MAPGRSRLQATRLLKPVVFCLLAVPLALLGLDLWREFQVPGSGFGPDPGEEIVHHLGSWALRILLVTLAVSPASRVFRTPQLVRYRRMAGLWAFTYVVLHFSAYVWLLGGFALETLAGDIVKRPYITVGFLALLMLIPLAITSTRRWQRRLGRRWKTLHRLVYPAAIAAWTHLLWLSKGGFMDPFVYGLVLVLLFGERIVVRIRKQRRAAVNAA
ncbi:MAG: sulfoxide reductase heme-binding subunit YedZ [Gammaproteobacteria bacterium]|nr:sulfoxide reductase heme-binding subunit YedZ [Gammaproteobacteria bacterium]